MREVDSTNIALGHLLLEAIDKKLDKKEALFNCFDKSWSQDFGNAWHQGYSKTW